MQFEVDPGHLTQVNDQMPHFWLFGSFKKAFFSFLNDPAWVVWRRNRERHLVLSKYAISSRSDVPNTSNLPKPIWIIQKGQNALTRRTENGLKKEPNSSRTCGFCGNTPRSLKFHANFFPENFLSRFSSKIWSKSKKGHFWHLFVIIEWSRIFSDKRASSCQVS